MGKGWKKCCISGCFSTTQKNRNLTFHKFPRAYAKRKEWMDRIPGCWNPKYLYPNLRICGLHFNSSGRKTDSNHNQYPEHFPFTKQDDATLVSSNILSPMVDAISNQIDYASYILDHNYCIPDTTHLLAKIAKLQEKCRSLMMKYIAKGDENAILNEQNGDLRKQVQHCETVIEKQKNQLKELSEMVKNLKIRNYNLNINVNSKKTVAYEDILNDDCLITFYTGFKNLNKFNNFYDLIQTFEKMCATCVQFSSANSKKIECKEQVFLVLSRLRLGLLEADLAHRHGVSVPTISRICRHWIAVMGSFFKQLPIWPQRHIVSKYMPQCFATLYPSTRVVLDCTELFIEKPSDFSVQSDTYSHYKSHNTAKGLIGITPNGYVSFVSPLYPGRMSDKDIFISSGILDLLEPGDSIMADRGFTIEDVARSRNVNVNIPPFVRNNQQLYVAQEQQTKDIASLRIHVERSIRHVKTFRILRTTFVNSMSDQLNDIWLICTNLMNFIDAPLLDRK